MNGNEKRSVNMTDIMLGRSSGPLEEDAFLASDDWSQFEKSEDSMPKRRLFSSRKRNCWQKQEVEKSLCL